MVVEGTLRFIGGGETDGDGGLLLPAKPVMAIPCVDLIKAEKQSSIKDVVIATEAPTSDEERGDVKLVLVLAYAQ